METIVPADSSSSTNQQPEVLDLCTKKTKQSQQHSPDHLKHNHHPPYQKQYNYNTTTPILCQFSPLSNTSDSDSTICNNDNNETTVFTTNKLKTPRPFKAYPNDPLHLALNTVNLEIPLNQDSTEAFAQFRKHVLSKIQSNYNNSGGTNKNMRRVTNNNQQKIDDPTYWEKRRKNNEAAKRSRDARRAKEDEIAIRCFYLEQENVQLKIKLAALENEKKRLHDLIYHHMG